MKRIINIALICLLFTTQAVASITDDVKKSVDEVVRIATDKEMKKDDHKRTLALKQAIDVIFDYNEMAKRSLGKHWNERTPAERNLFVELFSTLLITSYTGKFESYTNQKFVYVKETLDGNYAEVKSTTITASKDIFTLDYRLIFGNGKWMVYDVVIEGVSLVSNYRTQFNNIISNRGYSELLKKLQAKRDEM